MTGKERIKKAVCHENTDIIPYDPYVSPGHAIHLLGYQTHQMYTIPNLLPEAMIHATEFYKSDICYCRLDFYLGDQYEIKENKEETFFICKQTHSPVYKILNDSHNLIPLNSPKLEVINDVSEVKAKMPVIPSSEILKMDVAKVVRQYKSKLGNSTALFGSFDVGVTIKPLKKHRGFEQALMDLYENPKLVNAILERRYEQLHEVVLAFAQLGIDGFYTGDAEASCSLISPDIFRETLKQHYKNHICDIKKNGMIALLHICGKTNQILEDVADIGPDIFESLDPPSLGGDNTLADAKRRIGTKVCLKGNLDAPNLIKPGPVQKIYDECIKCCDVAYEKGGYILSTEQVTPDTPIEHVFAMEKARREFKSNFKTTSL